MAWRTTMRNATIPGMFVEALKPLDMRKDIGPWRNVLDAIFVISHMLKVCAARSLIAYEWPSRHQLLSNSSSSAHQCGGSPVRGPDNDTTQHQHIKHTACRQSQTSHRGHLQHLRRHHHSPSLQTLPLIFSAANRGLAPPAWRSRPRLSWQASWLQLCTRAGSVFQRAF